METNDKKIRLQKFLAERGVCSRRAAEKLMQEGRVTVNGSIESILGAKIDPDLDEIRVDGVVVGEREQMRYILLYKPTGYICSVKDERGRRTVIDLLSGVSERIYPIGRLDYDTSGLLLLTNDGSLTERLLHPSHEVKKTYRAVVTGVPSAQEINRLRKGVRLSDGMTAPAEAKIIGTKQDSALVELRIHEGRNRQVRRMLEAVNHPVLHLKRVGFAFLNLDGLTPGAWRELTDSEIAKLKQL